jgi:trk system potassium uptake protein TrkH
MIFPLLAAVLYREDKMVLSFALPMGISLAVALPVFLFTRKVKLRFTSAEGVFLVCSAWVTGSLFGAVPYYLSGYVPSFSNAVFECVSGISTTGVTIIPDVEILPLSFHLWRGMTHWLGGMGIVVLTVALVPLLGVGGFQLLKAETSGPMKEKFTPKVTNTAKILWLIYCVITVILFVLFLIGGMNWFDALIHSFSVMASGGFSTKNNSIAYYNSPFIDYVCIVFMFIAGFNYALIYRLLQGKFRDIINNSEAKAYGLISLIAAVVIAFSLFPMAGSVEKTLRYAFFDTASILSTSGLGIDNHNLWPPLARFMIFMLMFVGGCSGSTSGNIKIIRYVILFKQTRNELKRQLFPSGVFSIRLDNKLGKKDVVYRVAGFMFLYYMFILAGTLLVSSSGVELFDSLNASLICLGNIGFGLGGLTSGTIFYTAPDYVKWGSSLLMLIGRLEIFTVILLFIPSYWDK